MPYVTPARHFQESIAGPSHLHHLWARFLLCHGLSCAALYGPTCIPSILYLAFLQLEHGCFFFDYQNKKQKQKTNLRRRRMIFLCPQLTSQDSSGPFAASFRVSLATCTTGLWKEASTENGFRHPSLQRMMSLSADTSRLERQGQGSVLGPGAAVFCQPFDPWGRRFTSAGNSQEVK